MPASLKHENYTIAWIAIIPIEVDAAVAALDKQHAGVFESVRGDDYTYIGGEIEGHNVVIAKLPEGQQYGVGAAAALVNQTKARFPNIWFALLVGVAAGLPDYDTSDNPKKRDIRLGDVIVCVPDKDSTGVVHYDIGHDTEAGFKTNSRQAEPPSLVRSVIGDIKRAGGEYKRGGDLAILLEQLQSKNSDFSYPKATDELYRRRYEDGQPSGETIVQRTPREEEEKTRVFYGRIGSGNSLMRNPRRKEELRTQFDLLGLEMEAAGVMNTLPTGVIRGVCDYADGHKGDDWQAYAAAVAAVYAKAILLHIKPKSIVPSTPRIAFLPQRRCIHHLHRPTYADALASYFEGTRGDKRFVLYGLGGVGKTQIALDYAMAQSSLRDVFWIRSDKQASFIRDLGRIASADSDFKLASEDEILQSGRQALSRAARPLVIVDNADDLNEFLGKSPDCKDISQFLPPNCDVIVTSQDRRFLGGYTAARAGLKVMPMTRPEAVDLLESSIPHDLRDGTSDIEVSKFLDELGNLPLAIAQTATNVRELNYSLSDYITAYRKRKACDMLMQEHVRDEATTDSALHKSITTTWNLPLIYLEKNHQDSILCLMAIVTFHWRSVPRSLLMRLPSIADLPADTLQLAIGPLLRLSLLDQYCDADNVEYSLHPIVHERILNRFQQQERFEDVLLQSISSMAAIPPRWRDESGLTGKETGWSVALLLIPHVVHQIELAARLSLESKDIYVLLTFFSRSLLSRKQKSAAVCFSRLGLFLAQEVYGYDDILLYDLASILVQSLLQSADYAAARQEATTYLEKCRQRILTELEPQKQSFMGMVVHFEILLAHCTFVLVTPQDYLSYIEDKLESQDPLLQDVIYLTAMRFFRAKALAELHRHQDAQDLLEDLMQEYPNGPTTAVEYSMNWKEATMLRLTLRGQTRAEASDNINSSAICQRHIQDCLERLHCLLSRVDLDNLNSWSTMMKLLRALRPSYCVEFKQAADVIVVSVFAAIVKDDLPLNGKYLDAFLSFLISVVQTTVWSSAESINRMSQSVTPSMDQHWPTFERLANKYGHKMAELVRSETSALLSIGLSLQQSGEFLLAEDVHMLALDLPVTPKMDRRNVLHYSIMLSIAQQPGRRAEAEQYRIQHFSMISGCEMQYGTLQSRLNHLHAEDSRYAELQSRLAQGWTEFDALWYKSHEQDLLRAERRLGILDIPRLPRLCLPTIPKHWYQDAVNSHQPQSTRTLGHLPAPDRQPCPSAPTADESQPLDRLGRRNSSRQAVERARRKRKR